MKTYTIPNIPNTTVLIASVSLCFIGFLGCKTADEAKPATAEKSATASPKEKVVAPLPTIRINTGIFTPNEDSKGNHWLPDQGFADGDTIERPDLKIEGTEDQAIYQAERYAMSKFAQELPNGKYVVKLHFAETYEGIYGPGERVFSFDVEGQEFKDFDVWVKSGGFARAYVETVPVEITDGSLDIHFVANIEFPQINGIEILPAR